MAFRYYLQALFREHSRRYGHGTGDGTTHYFDLVSAIERWRQDAKARVLYVSFNYDTLLEQTLTSYLSYPFESISRYLTASWAVVKVHGSEDRPRRPGAGAASRMVLGPYLRLIAGPGP